MSSDATVSLGLLRATTSQLHELAGDLRTVRLQLDIRAVTGGRQARFQRGEEPDDGESSRSSLTPAEVEQGWRRGGRAWFDALSRRDVSAALAATADHRVGPLLAADPDFVTAIIGRTRARRAANAVSRMYLGHYPPYPHTAAAFAWLRQQISVENWPDWWKFAEGGPVHLAHALARALRDDDISVIRERWDLPEAVSSAGWAEAVVEQVRLTEVTTCERLIRFCDHGRDHVAPAAAGSSVVAAVRQIVDYGESNVGVRLQVAAVLRRRIGDVFGADANQWPSALHDQRNKVRSWVANELLTLLFQHLVPDNEFAHQTEPRRRFWRRYTGSVERLWLLVDPGLRDRLERAEVRDLLDRVGAVVDVRKLEGSPKQAILWMHLRTDANGVVSVVEGNANASVRIARGKHSPRGVGGHRLARTPVDYSREIVNGAFSDANADFVRRHAGDWQAAVEQNLRGLGVRASGR